MEQDCTNLSILPSPWTKVAVLAAVSALVVALVYSSPLMVLTILSGLASAGLLVIAVVEPRRLLYLMPVFLAIEQRIRVGPVSFAVAEACTAVVWIVVALDTRSPSDDRGTLFRKEWLLLAAIIVLAFPSAAFELDLKHALSSYRDLVVPLLFFGGLLKLRINRREITRLCQCFVLIAALCGALGIAQFCTGRFLWFQNSADAEFQVYKLGLIKASPLATWLPVGEAMAVGLYEEVNDFAAFLVIPAAVAFCWARTPESTKKAKTLWIACFLAMTVGLFLAFFRSGLFCLVAVCILWQHLRRKLLRSRSLLLPIILVGGLVALALLPSALNWDQLGTAEGRIDMFASAYQLISSSPSIAITGGHSDEFIIKSGQPQMVHNLFLYLLLRFGLGAALALVLLLFISLRKTVKWINRSMTQQRLFPLAVSLGVLIMAFVYGQTAGVMDNVQNSMWLFFWLGMVTLYCSSAPTQEAIARQ